VWHTPFLGVRSDKRHVQAVPANALFLFVRPFIIKARLRYVHNPQRLHSAPATGFPCGIRFRGHSDNPLRLIPNPERLYKNAGLQVFLQSGIAVFPVLSGSHAFHFAEVSNKVLSIRILQPGSNFGNFHIG
jgi:hypothetical protein